MTAYSFEDRSDFKFWRMQYPNAGRLLEKIIFEWRNCSAKVPGKPGKWSVYPIEQWCEWTGLSRDQAERALKRLVDDGLILRERHRFSGTTVRAFMQPTKLALAYAGRPQDLKRVDGPRAGISAGTSAGASAGTTAGTTAGTSAGTDYTPFPSIPPSPPVPPSPPSKSACALSGEGNGIDGEAVNDIEAYKLKLQKLAEQYAKTGKHDPSLDDEEKGIVEMIAKKLAKLDKMYPELKGPHEKFVMHPSKKFGFEKWEKMSAPLRASIYARYKNELVPNWYKGKKGKVYSQANWTDGDEAELQASLKASGIV